MRGFIITVVVLLILFFVGWLRLSNPDGKPTLQVDTPEIKKDTEAMVKEGKEVVDSVRAKLQNDAAEADNEAEPASDSVPDSEPASDSGPASASDAQPEAAAKPAEAAAETAPDTP